MTRERPHSNFQFSCSVALAQVT